MENIKRKINYIKVKREATDRCNICGKVMKLTWDHVPPKAITEGVAVNVNRLFDGVPKDDNCEAVYNKGIKFRSICSNCNNTLLGFNDKCYLEFTRNINSLLNNESRPPLFVEMQISKLCKAVLGHMLAAKDSYDEYCIIDKSIREYLLAKISRPDCKLYYWIYPYDTVNVLRDVSVVNTNNAIVPKGTISVIACFPVGFLLTDSDGYMPGLVDLISLITDNEEDTVRIPVNIESAFHPGTKKLRHFLWPCNIGMDNYSVGAVLVGKYGREDSRFGTRRGR